MTREQGRGVLEVANEFPKWTTVAGPPKETHAAVHGDLLWPRSGTLSNAVLGRCSVQCHSEVKADNGSAFLGFEFLYIKHTFMLHRSVIIPCLTLGHTHADIN